LIRSLTLSWPVEVRVVRQLSPQIVEWVSRNKDALIDFLVHGDTWTQSEVSDFIQKLQGWTACFLPLDP
jgi:hypothetical protein